MSTVTLWFRKDGGLRHRVNACTSQPLRTVFQTYCSRLGLPASHVRFFFGELISLDVTPDKRGLEDDHIIEVEVGVEEEEYGGWGR